MTRRQTPAPHVIEALRAGSLSVDGLHFTLAAQMDRKLYEDTAKALKLYGGKWNKRTRTHDFTFSFTDELDALLGGGKLAAKNPLSFFWTPEHVITEMVSILGRNLPDYRRVLEPSAGDGAIADYLAQYDILPDCFELDPNRRNVLEMRRHTVIGHDFLAHPPQPHYDLILMNPPFVTEGDKDAYIAHIEHAWKCLARGGEMVAIVPYGFVTNKEKRITQFREFVGRNGTYAPLPDTSFTAAGTAVRCALVYLSA